MGLCPWNHGWEWKPGSLVHCYLLPKTKRLLFASVAPFIKASWQQAKHNLLVLKDGTLRILFPLHFIQFSMDSTLTEDSVLSCALCVAQVFGNESSEVSCRSKVRGISTLSSAS